MKILAIEEGFPPELMSSHFAFEFAKELASRDHNVTVVTLFPREHLLEKPVILPRWKFFYWDIAYHKIRVARFFPQFCGFSSANRAAEYLLSSVSLLIGGFIVGKKDIIHVATPPLFVAFAGCILGKIRNIPIVLRIWDIHPDALEKIGVLKNRYLINFMKVIERFTYRYVKHITIISQSYKTYLMNEGVPENKITVIPLWTDLKKFQNDHPTYNFRQAFEVKNKFIVTYAGSLSWINDPELVIKAASLIQDYSDILFVFCGDGIKKESTMQLSKKLRLQNTLFVPPQPMDKYMEIIKESDVCILSLSKNFLSPALPARLPSMLACAKPIIANVPFESDTRKLIETARCGLWVPPEDYKSLADAVLKLYTDKSVNELFSNNSRKCAEEFFSTESCMNSYDKILRQIINKEIKNCQV